MKSKGKDTRDNSWNLWYLVMYEIKLGMMPLGFVLEARFEKTVICVDGSVDCLSFHTLSLQHCFCWYDSSVQTGMTWHYIRWNYIDV